MTKGYSKKLLCECVSCDVVQELLDDEAAKVSVELTPTITEKGDVFAEALNPAQFVTACASIGIVNK